MNVQLFLPLIRYFLQAIAGSFVTSGYIDGELANILVGLGIGLTTVLWYYIEQYIKEKNKDD